ncbi:MAG: nucleotidyltransferase domain-containing protein [Patescibacteria group bacterium]|nr:nucleotidyltransferase domain-containing protein [Patescibacteria group bacterium]
MTQLIQNHRQDLIQVAKDNKIDYLALYGSHARGENTDASDIDLLVSFDKKASVSLFDLASIQIKMSEILGKKVDLVTKSGLSQYVRPYIQDDIQVIYAKKS